MVLGTHAAARHEAAQTGLLYWLARVFLLLADFSGIELGHLTSAAEQIAAWATGAHVVKAFNTVGNPHMVDPQFPGGPPTMFLCGNNPDAKRVVSGICGQFGWEPFDCGDIAASRALEPLCMLWCLPGFLRNDWRHAFKMLTK